MVPWTWLFTGYHTPVPRIRREVYCWTLYHAQDTIQLKALNSLRLSFVLLSFPLSVYGRAPHRTMEPQIRTPHSLRTKSASHSHSTKEPPRLLPPSPTPRQYSKACLALVSARNYRVYFYNSACAYCSPFSPVLHRAFLYHICTVLVDQSSNFSFSPLFSWLESLWFLFLLFSHCFSQSSSSFWNSEASYCPLT